MHLQTWLLWIRPFLSELYNSIVYELIYQDNTTTISMIQQDGISERSKHIGVKFNFVKRLVKNKAVVYPHVVTKKWWQISLLRTYQRSRLEDIQFQS